jgi:flagellar biosynthetic protein FliR
MFEISVLQIQDWLSQFVWPLFRVSAFFMTVPVIGTHLVPPRIRMALAVLICFLIQPFLPQQPAMDLSVSALGIIFQQTIIGFAMGFSLQIVFHVFVLAGQVISMQMGLGFASMNDPMNGVSVAVLSQFYLMLAMLLYLGIGGHLITIRALVESFTIMPVNGYMMFNAQSAWYLVSTASWMFGSALLISLPAVTALLVVNIAFGVMTRSAPQLNIFSLGFPMTLLFGLVVVWVGLSDFQSQFVTVMNQGFVQLRELLLVH